MILSDKEYSKVKVTTITGRYITNEHIQEFLNGLPAYFKIQDIGLSVQKNTIQSITIGTGPKRILMWSQMHGNESTTTKAVLDFLNCIQLQIDGASRLLEVCTFKMIPILNPDGAKAYMRVNANGVDLNRDAQELSQPESQLLRKEYEQFAPHYCFNLHDQRTIFNVGDTKLPATVSFLAPAFDVGRNISSSREISMLLIAAMNKTLQNIIPGQVGRYDDGFNPNCVGDAFQMSNTPTVLFEAGHFYNDYKREETRKYIFLALLTAVHAIAEDTFNSYTIADYSNIPNNNKFFCDILIKNAGTLDGTPSKTNTRYVLYKEVLENGNISFEPKLMTAEDSKDVRFGHVTKDCKIMEDLQWLADNGILRLLK